MAQPLQAFDKYMQLIQSGMPSQQALDESGLTQLRLEQQKKLAAQQQQAGFGELGGTLVGALGTKAITDVAQGQKALGGLREGLSNIGKEVSGLFGPSAPTGIGPVASGAEYAKALGDVGQAATQTANQAATITPVAETGMFAPGSTLGTALGGLGVGLGAYGAFKGIKKGDPLSAGLGGLGLASGLSQLGLLGAGPLGWAGLIAAPVVGSLFGKDVSAQERNVRKTKALLKMGFTPEQLGTRVDDKGNPVMESNRFTKEAGETWKQLTSSTDPNINPLRQATGIWGAEGMLETFGPDYFNKMSEFDRYVAGTAAVENNQIYQKKGELLVKDKEGLKATVDQYKADPQKLAQLQANYNAWKNTGKDIGIPKMQTQQQKETEDKIKSIYTTYND